MSQLRPSQYAMLSGQHTDSGVDAQGRPTSSDGMGHTPFVSNTAQTNMRGNRAAPWRAEYIGHVNGNATATRAYQKCLDNYSAGASTSPNACTASIQEQISENLARMFSR